MDFVNKTADGLVLLVPGPYQASAYFSSIFQVF